MSYPYGPESYPTFESLENERLLEQLRSAYYYDLHRRVADRNAKLDREKVRIEISDGERDMYGSLYREENYGEATVEDRGIAFAHALEYAFDEEDKLDRFFQDVFSMLEDKIVSKADADEGDWYEDSSRMAEAAAIKELADTGDERAGMYEEDYKRAIFEHEQFTHSKVQEVIKRANANARKHGIDHLID